MASSFVIWRVVNSFTNNIIGKCHLFHFPCFVSLRHTVLTVSNQAVKMSDSAITRVISALAPNCWTLWAAPWVPGTGHIDLSKELCLSIRAWGYLEKVAEHTWPGAGVEPSGCCPCLLGWLFYPNKVCSLTSGLIVGPHESQRSTILIM